MARGAATDTMPGGRPIRQLTWDDKSHWRVLTQTAGSVWPKVLPYCILNAALTYGVYYLKNYKDLDLTSASKGHKYMSMLMAFLVVTRVKITYDNYMQNATNLTTLYQSIRGLVQDMCVLTAQDKSERAKLWRQDVTYAAIVLLRVTIAVLEYQSKPQEDPWAVAATEMKLRASSAGGSDKAILSHLSDEDDGDETTDDDDYDIGNSARGGGAGSSRPFLAHGSVDPQDNAQEDQLQIHMLEEACRAPITLAYNVRREILKQRDGSCLDRQKVWLHPCNEETRLCDYVGQFIKGFHGLKKLLLTPIPFPLVQMAKTFLFIWLFTLPFALCHDDFHSPIVPILLIFLITFGFCGLEFTAMELSDPFGDDPSDFDDLGFAQMTFEDCYISIYKLDGDKWAAALRQRVVPRMKRSSFYLLRDYNPQIDEYRTVANELRRSKSWRVRS